MPLDRNWSRDYTADLRDPSESFSSAGREEWPGKPE